MIYVVRILNIIISNARNYITLLWKILLLHELCTVALCSLSYRERAGEGDCTGKVSVRWNIMRRLRSCLEILLLWRIVGNILRGRLRSLRLVWNGVKLILYKDILKQSRNLLKQAIKTHK